MEQPQGDCEYGEDDDRAADRPDNGFHGIHGCQGSGLGRIWRGAKTEMMQPNGNATA